MPYLTKPAIINAINSKYEKSFPVNNNVIISIVRSNDEELDVAIADFNSGKEGIRKFGAELLIFKLPWFDGLFTKDDFDTCELGVKIDFAESPFKPLNSIGSETVISGINHLLKSHSVIEKRTIWFTEERFYVLTDVRKKILNKRKKSIFNIFRGGKK